MQPACPHCDVPDSTLLRLVLLGEIMRAEEDSLVTIAEVLQHLGLVQLTETDEASGFPPVSQWRPRLRLARSTPHRPVTYP
jgi:hypothetical protein